MVHEIFSSLAGFQRLVCRPALPMDTAAVLELTRTIWAGEDYVPSVWEEWLQDASGLLAVAELGGKVVGLGKLTRFSNSDWWLEGLRVHPAYEGRGIASHLHDYLLAHWERHGNGTIRLATASFRLPVQHLCDRSGFTRLGEFTSFEAPALHGKAPSFQPLPLSEIDKAAAFAVTNPVFAYSRNLLDLGWQWTSFNSTLLEQTARRGLAWWWRDKQGLAAAWEDELGQGWRPLVQLLACQPEQAVECLLDFRRQAAVLGCQQVGWTAPMHTGLLPSLERAGFNRSWEASLFIYAKDPPTRKQREGL